MRCSIVDFISKWYITLLMRDAKRQANAQQQPRGLVLRKKLEATLEFIGARDPRLIPSRKLREGVSLWEWFENLTGRTI